MNKITIDIDDQTDYGAPIYFETQEDWDAFPHSSTGRAATWKHGTYQPICKSEPERFPCYYFEGALIYQPNGPDEYANYFIYPAKD